MTLLAGDLLVALLSSVPAALFGLWLARHANSRDQWRRRLEYRRVPHGQWQAWRHGLYDIRDWAIGARSYLKSRSPEAVDFSAIRVPGHRYLQHLIATDRIPSEQLHQALVLSEYCELFAAAFAHVIARDLDHLGAARTGMSRMSDGGLSHDRSAEPAIIQLAEVIEDIARDILDPKLREVRNLPNFAATLPKPASTP